jgi:protein-S-isoprenylcysteine O-methyltransferase Ste14
VNDVSLKKLLPELIGLFAFIALLVFGSAGSVRYWQGWLFLATFCASTLAITLYLLKYDPELLQRRSTGGPAAERSTIQKIIMSLASICFLALLVVPALDHRYRWSTVPGALSLCADLLLVGCFAYILKVFRANSFAAATIAVAPGQRVVSTGPYAHVRHPMYAAGLVLLAALPLSLGSWWGLLVMIPLVPLIVWRLVDEEAFLTANLAGYGAYRERVKYRLVPFLW